MAAHRPEEPLRTIESTEFLGGKQPGADQVSRLVDAVHIFADPIERVQVAKASLAVLDVRLDDVTAVAHPDVPFVALGELGGDELGGRAGHYSLSEAFDCEIEDLLVSPQPARLEKGRADCHVLLRQRDQLGKRADGVPDLELQVPQKMQRRFGRALLRGSRRFRRQEHEVEVAIRSHFAATRPAKSDKRETVAAPLINHSAANEVPGKTNKLVMQESAGVRGGPAIPGLLDQTASDFGAARRQYVGQNLGRSRQLRSPTRESAKTVGNGATLNDRS